MSTHRFINNYDTGRLEGRDASLIIQQGDVIKGGSDFICGFMERWDVR